MNTKSVMITVIVLWVVNFFLGYVLNALILNWSVLPMAKTEMVALDMVYIAIGSLVFSFFFAFIFALGQEGKGIAEGFRFGLYVGLLIYLTGIFIASGTASWPAPLLFGYHIGSIVITVIMGIITAAMYKPKAAEE